MPSLRTANPRSCIIVVSRAAIGRAIVPRHRGSVEASLRWSSRPDEAIADYEAALDLRPDLWQAWGARAILLAQAGRAAEAGRSFEEAIRHAPEAERPKIEEQRRRLLGR